MKKPLSTAGSDSPSPASGEFKGRDRRRLFLSDNLSAIGELAGSIVHDMNNPLTVIRGFSQLLLMNRALDEKVRKDIEAISESGKKLSEIIERLAALSRKTAVKPERIDIGGVLQDSARGLEEELSRRQILVRHEVQEHLPAVWGEADRLITAFSNILHHSARALSVNSGHREILVRAHLKEDRVMVEFSDNGPGVKEPDGLFTPFHSLEGGGSADNLGLCASSGIIKKHKGRLWLDTEYHQGMKFIVELPLAGETGTGS